MSTDTCILIVHDDPATREALDQDIRKWSTDQNLTLLYAPSVGDADTILEEKARDIRVIVTDFSLSDLGILRFLSDIKKTNPDIVTVILFDPSNHIEFGTLLQSGVFGYIQKPWDSILLVEELQKALEHGELKRQNARYLRVMEEELKWAGEMQKALLRPTLPAPDNVEFLATYHPFSSLHCGGDYYDVIFLNPDTYLLIVGDVAGHGVRAALVTGILKAVIYPGYVRSALDGEFSPGDFLGWLNDRMNFELRQTSGLIITFVAGVLDMSTRAFRYANAGHPAPVLLRAGHEVEALHAFGPGLGLTSSLLYEEDTVPVHKNDVITLFTDGLLEIEDTQKNLRGYTTITPALLFESVTYGPEYHEKLMRAALDRSGTQRFSDDVTLVTARIT
jgi:phosphoserine phosphatase RsbU/P